MRAYDSLKRPGEFTRLYRRGQRTQRANFVIYSIRRQPGPMLRVGIAISKPVGKAVQRNLVRRRLQGTLDTLDLSRATNADILIVAKPGAAQLSYADLAQQLTSGLREPLLLSAPAPKNPAPALAAPLIPV